MMHVHMFYVCIHKVCMYAYTKHMHTCIIHIYTHGICLDVAVIIIIFVFPYYYFPIKYKYLPSF